MKFYIEFGGLAIVALSIVSCGFPSKEGNAPVTEAVSFAQINDVILKPSCLSCHGASQLPLLRTYADVKANLKAIERVVTVTMTMPKRGPLPSDQIELLKKWIAEGAPEIPAAAPTTTELNRPAVKWAELQAKVIGPKCAACHFAKNPDDLSDLEDEESFRSLIGAIFFLSVAKPTMPPPPKETPEDAPNPNALTRSEKEMLAHWVVDGMQK